MPQLYRTFKRSCTNYPAFAKARKMTVSKGITLEQARNECEEYNKNRTAAQIRMGTMMGFEPI